MHTFLQLNCRVCGSNCKCCGPGLSWRDRGELTDRMWEVVLGLLDMMRGATCWGGDLGDDTPPRRNPQSTKRLTLASLYQLVCLCVCFFSSSTKDIHFHSAMPNPDSEWEKTKLPLLPPMTTALVGHPQVSQAFSSVIFILRAHVGL
jgi:hypothetical protein